jgi:hypothetical protein
MNTAEKIKAHIEYGVERREHIIQMPYLIGISGKAGAGKSETSYFLEGVHRYDRYSFADCLKRSVCELFRIDKVYSNNHKLEPIEFFEVVTARELWQFMGTEVCRAIFGPYFFVWISATYFRKQFPRHTNYRVVYDDVRFQEEADWILECGGTLIHLTRKGADGKVGIPDHASEQGYQTTNTKLYRKGENYFEVENNGTIFDLGYQINRVLAAVKLAQTTI